MENIILRTNAIPVYGFLSYINAQYPHAGQGSRGKILDCGAGGPVPPLALFQRHGFEGWGIDASEQQVERARQFCAQQGVPLKLRTGDMRHMPFEGATFDYVYEHYSMCHLSKQDTALAISEMHRVLKPQGLCFLGVISMDCWPKSLFGVEKEPGEFWGEEAGHANTLHSMFTDEEADALVSEWEIVSKEKQVHYLRQAAANTSVEEWMNLYQGNDASRQAWQAKYASRVNIFQYAHTYFFLKKV